MQTPLAGDVWLNDLTRRAGLSVHYILLIEIVLVEVAPILGDFGEPREMWKCMGFDDDRLFEALIGSDTINSWYNEPKSWRRLVRS